MKLEEIANVMIGILAKRESDENGVKSYPLFSLKNYESEQDYETLKTNKNLNAKLAQKGDLLFRLLCPNKVIYVDEVLAGVLVPSQFCIIRSKTDEMKPIILKWYLESKNVQEELEGKATGSIIKSMPLSNLKTLKIPNISKETQNKMEKLILLWEREKQISKEILSEKEKLYNFYFKEMLKEEGK